MHVCNYLVRNAPQVSCRSATLLHLVQSSSAAADLLSLKWLPKCIINLET